MVLRIQSEFLLCLEALQAGIFHVSLTSSPTLLFSQLRLSHTGLFPVIHTQPSTMPLASSLLFSPIILSSLSLLKLTSSGEPSLSSLYKSRDPRQSPPPRHFIFFLSSTYLLRYLFSASSHKMLFPQDAWAILPSHCIARAQNSIRYRGNIQEVSVKGTRK